MTKLRLNYSDEHKKYNDLSIPLAEYEFLKSSLNSVLTGTANSVGTTLRQNNIDPNPFICKTGTAEKGNRSGNASSSFVIANDNFTIGLMLSGTIPQNREKLSAKDLFNNLIPLLTKYEILRPTTN
jgi:cell division protein FtsI/penicillin-binding protein 2